MGWLELIIGGAIGWFVVAPMVSPFIQKGLNMVQSGVEQMSSGQARYYGYPAFADFRGRGIDITGRSINTRYRRMKSFQGHGRPIRYHGVRNFN